MWGFTLVELLIVVAIIAMLTATVSVFYSGTRAKSRDARREQDIKTLVSALSLYVASSPRYPVYTGYITGADSLSVDLKNSGSVEVAPTDPTNSGNYRYHYYSADGTDYTITYYLETDSIPGKTPGVNTAGP
ncbi:MAG: prepilin-type N-terminal cleavage/methylation domain-containing protein [Candidatus Sungbacteria bacterium]|nr:prepilin-type N-terminal cleavage/methylation domain-containing protein [Candidatus Sungbacteria bacterium]